MIMNEELLAYWALYTLCQITQIKWHPHPRYLPDFCKKINSFWNNVIQSLPAKDLPPAVKT